MRSFHFLPGLLRWLSTGAIGLLLGAAAPSLAATSINATNHFAYGANLGWVDWRGDTNQGAFAASNVFSGYIYAADTGWISLGNGIPANGVHYQNNSASDYGVNIDGAGNLTGYAYGANIGWIAFEANGAPRLDLASGRFTGAAYSANCGWISLSNAVAYVQSGGGVAGPAAGSLINGLSRQPNGSYLLYGTGVVNVTYTVLANTNLATTNWIPIGTATAGALGALQYFDSNAPNFRQRFYRFSYP